MSGENKKNEIIAAKQLLKVKYNNVLDTLIMQIA